MFSVRDPISESISILQEHGPLLLLGHLCRLLHRQAPITFDSVRPFHRDGRNDHAGTLSADDRPFHQPDAEFRQVRAVREVGRGRNVGTRMWVRPWIGLRLGFGFAP